VDATCASRTLPANHSQTGFAIPLGADQLHKILAQDIADWLQNVTTGEHVSVGDNEKLQKAEYTRRLDQRPTAEVFEYIFKLIGGPLEPVAKEGHA
jgi:hypothetical protein